MPNSKKTDIKYFSFLFLLFIIVITYILLRPFFITIISSVVLTYLFFPLYRKIKKHIKSKNVSSFITCLLIFLLFLIPLGLVINLLTREAISSYVTITNFLTNNQFNIDEINVMLLDRFGFEINLRTMFLNIFNFFIQSSRSFIVSIPKRILDVFILFFLMYYLFKDGKNLKEKVKKYLPLKDTYKEKLAKEIGDMTHAVVFGIIVTSFIQSAIGALGLFIFGIGNPLLWGIVMFILCILPLVGPTLVWVPASMYLFISGIISSSPLLIGKGIGLFLYGLIIISSIDNILRPKLIGKKTNVSPAIIMLGIFGGLYLFGLVGLVIGPIILSIFISTLKIYGEEK